MTHFETLLLNDKRKQVYHRVGLRVNDQARDQVWDQVGDQIQENLKWHTLKR